MSSHHVVRENQEPALFIASWNALHSEYIGQLLEWSPTVLTNDYSVDFLLAEGIKVDVLFTKEQDDFKHDSLLIYPVKSHVFDDVLRYLIDRKHRAVYILCDEVPETIYFYAEQINIVLFINNIRYALVRGRFEKWKPRGQKMYMEAKYLKSLVGVQAVAVDEFVTQQDGFIFLEFNTTDFVLIGEEV